jgi:hypothetical protein
MPATSPLGAIGGCDYTILFVDDGSQDDSYRPGARDIDWIPADGRPLSLRQAFGRRDEVHLPEADQVRLDGITAFSTLPPALATWLGSGAEVSTRNRENTEERKRTARADEL